MLPLRVLAPLTLILLTLTACTGGSADTPTPSPTQAAAATVGTNVKIVTDIGGVADATGTPTTPTPTPTEVLPTNTPLPLARLEILSQSTYKDSAGGIWVVGEAQNTGTATATAIEVTLSLLGADGKRAVVSYATTHLSEVPPGGKTPFRGLFATPPQGDEQVKVGIRTVPAYPGTASELVPGLVVQESQLSPPAGSGGAIVSGQVKNGGKDVASMIRVLAVSRDANGNVTDVADGYARGTNIAAGAQAPFSLQFPHAKEAPSFEVFVQSALQATSEATPPGTPLATPQATPQVTPQTTPQGTPQATPQATATAAS